MMMMMMMMISFWSLLCTGFPVDFLGGFTYGGDLSGRPTLHSLSD